MSIFSKTVPYILIKLSVSLAGPGPRRVMSVRENIINRLRGNSQGNFTVMLNPMGISTNIFQIQFAKNFHVRY